MPWLCVSVVSRELVRGLLWGEAARCWCVCWPSWLVARLASMLDMAGNDGAVGCVWAAGCCVGRWHWVPGGLDCWERHCLSWVALCPVHAGQRGRAVIWCYFFLMCSQTMCTPVVSSECWLCQAKPSQSSNWGRRLVWSASRCPPVCQPFPRLTAQLDSVTDALTLTGEYAYANDFWSQAEGLDWSCQRILPVWP